MKYSACYFIFLVFFLYYNQQATARELSGILLKTQGDVQYFDGKRWRSINYDKFLFDGYSVKTGEQGLCKIVVTQNGKYYAIGKNSEVKINKNELNIISGYIGKASPVGMMFASLPRKYQRAISNNYVTRSVSFDTVKEMYLSSSHPNLIWNNMGNKYTYRLHVGDKTYGVPASSNKIIEYKLNLIPGRYKYHVEAIKDSQVAKCSNKNHFLIWLGQSEMNAFHHDIAAIKQLDNNFLLASAYEQFGLKVPAMINYQKYFKNNPTADNEMKDMLKNLYKDLHLDNMFTENAQLHAQEEGGCLWRWLLWPFCLFF